MGKFKNTILQELGETQETYDWKLRSSDNTSSTFFEFETPNHHYSVTFSVHNLMESGYIYTTFDNEKGIPFGRTEEGNQFKVVSTVIKVAEFVWKSRRKFFDVDQDLEGFKFDAGGVRTNLYKKFVKHRFPDAQFEKTSINNEMKVKLN